MLTWDLTGIADHHDVCFESDETGERRMRAVTEVLILGTMLVGLNYITEKTASEFCVRLAALYTAMGYHPLAQTAPDGSGRISRHLTLAEVRAHVGLKTNATAISKRAFVRKLGETLLLEISHQIAREQQQNREPS